MYFGLAQMANHFEKWLAVWQFCTENGQGPAVIFNPDRMAIRRWRECPLLLICHKTPLGSGNCTATTTLFKALHTPSVCCLWLTNQQCVLATCHSSHAFMQQ